MHLLQAITYTTYSNNRGQIMTTQQKVVCMYADNQEIKKLVTEIEETKKRSIERYEFLTKQIEKLREESETSLRGVWTRLEEEIDRQKLIVSGDSASKFDLQIDEDVQCIKMKEKRKGGLPFLET
jgi:archaellum component FlaC